MQKQLDLLPYFLNSAIIYKYESKKLLATGYSTNRLVFFTETQMHVINPSIQKHIATFMIDANAILKFVISVNNEICLLYANGVMEIRALDSMAEIIHRFKDVEVKCSKIFPQLYWRNDDIYVLTESKLELFDLAQKQRKVYLHSDLMSAHDTKNLLGLVDSKLLDRERIIIMQFVDKMTFNIVPISITYMPITNVTKFLSLYSPKHKSYTHSQPRQFIAVIIQNRTLKIFNIINMKQLIEIYYEQTQHETVDLTCDMNREFLLVTFVTKKNKVTRNILYKINTEEYYNGKNLFREEESFFLFEIELEIKQKLIAFESELILSHNKNFLAVDLCHIRHYAKRSKGELVLSTLVINHEYLLSKPMPKWKTKCPDWHELREWKDIITSYIEMKNTLDLIDFSFPEQNSTTGKKKKETKQEDKKKLTIEKKPQEPTSKKVVQNRQKAFIIEDHQKQMQMEIEKYQKLKISLLDGAHKFKNQVLTLKNHEDHEKKLEEEFYKFMSQYLKEQKLDFDTEMLFEAIEDKNKGRLSEISSGGLQEEELQLLEVNERQLIKRKDQKATPGSKSSQRLVKYANVESSLNRTKSSANEQFEGNIKQKGNNNSFVSSFSERKLEVVTKSQENIERDKSGSSVYGSEHDQLAIKITEAIMKAFEPLEKRLDRLDQQLARTESIHMAQLQKCQRSTEKQVKDIVNIDMTIKGYCTQLLIQFDKTLQSGLRSYWLKIEQIDKKAARERDKAINTFGTFIDQQIKNREEIFDHSRFCIENTLSHLRKKLGNMFNSDEKEDIYEQEEEGDNWVLAEMKRRNKQYAYGINFENENEQWEDEEH